MGKKKGKKSPPSAKKKTPTSQQEAGPSPKKDGKKQQKAQSDGATAASPSSSQTEPKSKSQKQKGSTQAVPGTSNQKAQQTVSPIDSAQQSMSVSGPIQQSRTPPSTPVKQASAPATPVKQSSAPTTPVGSAQKQQSSTPSPSFPAWGLKKKSSVPASPASPAVSQPSFPAWGLKQSSAPATPAGGSKQQSSAPTPTFPAWGQKQGSSVPASPAVSQPSFPAWGLKQSSAPATPVGGPKPQSSAQPAWGPKSQSPMSSPQKPSPQKPSSQTTTPQKKRQVDLSKTAKDLGNLSLSTLFERTPIPTSALIPVAPNKGCGKSGRPDRIDVNFLPLVVQKIKSTVYQYDVTIEPELPKRMLPTIFEVFRKQNFENIFLAFDGRKIAVSPQRLPFGDGLQEETEVYDERGKARTYKVSIKEARDSEIDFNSLKTYVKQRQYDAPMRALQMLEIVLKSAFLNKNGVQVGRSFFMATSPSIDLTGGCELWTGLYQSTVLGSVPFLNVDIAHKAFPSAMNVYEIHVRNTKHNETKPIRRSPRQLLNDLELHLRDLLIIYAMPGHNASPRTYKFLSFNERADTFKFKNEQDNRDYTIAQYFTSRGVTIQHLDVPTLKLGNVEKNITVPMEFCKVAGSQAVIKRCTDEQTKNVISRTAISTIERRKKIDEILKKISHNNSPTLKQFGVEIGNTFVEVSARILPAPELAYNLKIAPNNGQWSFQYDTKFREASIIPKYAVLNLGQPAESRIKHFFSALDSKCSAFGMQPNPRHEIFDLQLHGNIAQSEETVERKMLQIMDSGVKLLFCIIHGGDNYSLVKRCAELKCGLLTQCIKMQTLQRLTDNTITNILLKLNAKLNGSNHRLLANPMPMRGSFMLIGADVTHPSPGQDDIPSVVGVVSSHDSVGFQYNKCWRLQDPKQEVISDFESILREHLEFFFKKNKFLPDVILYYRDGVSEGQFQNVLTTELTAMYSGCQKYRDGYKPKITFVVVQKRHHTRFFPSTNSKYRSKDKNFNVLPGTIVDSHITHPNESQFYLVSHHSGRGVARPTKYCVLRDDSNFPIDDLQILTYNLCYLFARCLRSVSYPAPTYYAHLAASRGRAYIEGRRINMSNLKYEYSNRRIKDEICKGHPMYFV